jgi:hypothetical protein
MNQQINQQWQNLLQNLGEWRGSFTRFSPQGEVLEDWPTTVTLAGLDHNQTVQITVNYHTAPEHNVQMTLNTVGRDMLIHENGAFSWGSMQVSPLGEFGTELGLRHGDRRLRIVQRFMDREFQRATLIREALPNSTTPEGTALTVTDVVGTWRGQGISLFTDARSPLTVDCTTTVTLASEGLGWTDAHLGESLHFTPAQESEASDPTQTSNLSKVYDAEAGSNPLNATRIRLLLLPGGAFSRCPVRVPLGQPFALEVGWHFTPQHRYRLRREYDGAGTWISLTLITEERLPF